MSLWALDRWLLCSRVAGRSGGKLDVATPRPQVLCAPAHCSSKHAESPRQSSSIFTVSLSVGCLGSGFLGWLLACEFC